jgi:hypothetical protein
MNDSQVDPASKVFLFLAFLLLVISMSAAYYKYIVLEDYEIYLLEEEEPAS